MEHARDQMEDHLAKNPRLQQLHDWLGYAENSLPETTYRTSSLEDYQFYAGDQDTKEVKEELQAQSRPITTYNEIKPKIDMLVGLAAQTKYESELVPAGKEDEPLTEVMNGVLKHYQRNMKILRKELDCFDHTVKSGRSLLYFFIDKSNPFKPKLMAKRFPGDHFLIDPDSIEYDLSDARYIFLDQWLTEEEIKRYWPDLEPELIKGIPGGRAGDAPAFWNESKEKYRVVECWYREHIRVIWFINPMTGKEEKLTPGEFTKFQNLIKEGLDLGDGERFQTDEPLMGIAAWTPQVKYSIFSGPYEMEHDDSPYNWEGFPAVLYGAYKAADTNAWFSVVNVMKDPQRAINTMRRQLSHLLQTLPKGLLVHEIGVISNIEEYEERSADPTFHLEVSKGSIEKYKFESQPAISPIYQTFDQAMSQAMKDGSGIQDPMLGIQTTSREPGISVRMRQEQGLAVLYTLFDNFRDSRLQSGRLLLSLIQQYVTWPQIIRIEGKKGAQLMEINTEINPQVEGFNDISAAEFDMIIDETVETASTNLAIAQILVDFAQNNPGSIPPDLILDYANIPYSVKQRVKDFYEQQAEQARKAQEAELALKAEELDIKRIQAEASAAKTKESKKGE